MRWSQKLFGVSLHLEKLDKSFESGSVLKPEEFDVSDDEIRLNSAFAGRIKHMSVMSEDYAARKGTGATILHKHRGSGRLIMKGTVEKASGLVFEQEEEVWSCKLPNRAAFIKWRNCQVKTANRATQKYVMFYLAKEGAEFGNYRQYPFDVFPEINTTHELADFLNELAKNRS